MAKVVSEQDGLVARVDTVGNVQVPLVDGLGSVRAITDGSGNVTQTYRTDEFGAPVWTPGGSVSQPFQYTGQQRDSTGLVYLRARMYDPTIGRFLQRDPAAGTIADPLSLNRYTYAMNNPTTAVDPSGEIPLLLVTAVVGALVSGGVQLGIQAWTHRDDPSKIDLRAVGVATGVGFGAGFFAPFVATTVVGAVALGAAANVGQYFATQFVEGQTPTLQGAAASLVTGAAGGFAAGRIVAATGWRFDEASPALVRWVARSLNNRAAVAANVTAGNALREAVGAGVADLNPDAVSKLRTRFVTPAAAKK